MKYIALKAAALLMAIATLTGCVNEDYDLKSLDSSMTILSGLKIHVNHSEGDKPIIKNSSYLSQNQSITELPNSNLAISCGQDAPKRTMSSYSGGGQILFDTPLLIGTASWLNDILPGAILSVPLVPVIEVTNPSGIEMKLYGTARCGDLIVDFGPYPVLGGTTCVKLDTDRIVKFFMPVNNDVEISNLRLVWDDRVESPAEEDEFSIRAYAPLAFNPGDKITLEYPCSQEFLSKIDLQEKAEKHHISVESLSVEVDMTNSFPLDLNIYASGELDNGPASASIYPTVAAGSVENPVTTTITVKASLAKGAHAINSATVCVEGKVPGSSPVYITSDQNLNYSVVTITLDSGITLGL